MKKQKTKKKNKLATESWIKKKDWGCSCVLDETRSAWNNNNNKIYAYCAATFQWPRQRFTFNFNKENKR